MTDRVDRFLQPADSIRIVSRAPVRALLTDEDHVEIERRVAAGENRVDVTADVTQARSDAT